MKLELDSLVDSSDVEQAVLEFYGTDLIGQSGVIHTTAVWRSPDEVLFTLNINGDTPPSRHDRFALNVARARADAIITTGKILREEPSVTASFIGSSEDVAPLADWRRVSLGKKGPPVALVLTSGRSLDLDHPFFRTPVPAIIFTSHEAATGIMSAALERSIGVVSHETPSITAAVTFLQQEMGSGTVAIEAGAASSLQLYRPSLVVEELLLSEFLGASLAPSVRGAPFLETDAIETMFAGRSEPYVVEEPSGPWRFRRWTRRAAR